MQAKKTIPEMLVKDLPKSLVLTIEEAFHVSAQRAFRKTEGVHPGHFNSYLGQLRHFEANDLFYKALEAAGAAPTPIRGNAVITGRTGRFVLARFASRGDAWVNARRSVTRRHLAMMNAVIERKMQGDLFLPETDPSQSLVFFFATFSTDPGNMREPIAVSLAVPDRHLRKWLFVESVASFLTRYETPKEAQPDHAFPKKKQKQRDGTQS